MPHDGMQIDGSMRLIAVKVQRHGYQRAVHPQQRDEQVAPDGKVRETVEMGS
ncbi:hypothetical protein D3C83_189130 [compost metagenome]